MNKEQQIEKSINNLSEEEAKQMLLNLIENSYQVVTWPDSQELMDKKWFGECVLDTEAQFGSSAYFVPTKRLL